MIIMDEYGAILTYEKFRYLTIPNFIYYITPLSAALCIRCDGHNNPCYRILSQKTESFNIFSLSNGRK